LEKNKKIFSKSKAENQFKFQQQRVCAQTSNCFVTRRQTSAWS